MGDTYRGFADRLTGAESFVSIAIVFLSLGLILWLRSKMRRP